MRSYLAVAACLSLSVAAFAQPGGPGVDKREVSVEAVNRPLTDVLADLGRQIGAGVIGQGTDATLVTLSLSKTPFGDCMDLLADTFSLIAGWEGNALVARSMTHAVQAVDRRLADGEIDALATLMPAANGQVALYGSEGLRKQLAGKLQQIVSERTREWLALGEIDPDLAIMLASIQLQDPALRPALVCLGVRGLVRDGRVDAALEAWNLYLRGDRSPATTAAWAELFTALHYAASPYAVAFWQQSFSPDRVADALGQYWSAKRYQDGLHFARLNLRYATGTGRSSDAARLEQIIATTLGQVRTIDVTCAVDADALTDPRTENKVRVRVGKLSDVYEREFGIRFRVTDMIAWNPPSSNGFEPQYAALRQALGTRKPELTLGFILEVFQMHPSQFQPMHKHLWIGYGCPHVGAYLLTRDFSFEYITATEALEWTFKPGAVEETLVHEMAHMFGALHVDDPTSVMRPTSNSRVEWSFDEVNRQIIMAGKWRDFSVGVDSLDIPELLTIIDRYHALAGQSATPNGAAQEIARCHLALAKLYSARREPLMARQHLQEVLAIGEPKDVLVEAQAMFAG